MTATKTWTLCLLAGMLTGNFARAQSPSRNEKREAKVRSEYLKLTADIHVPSLPARDLLAQLHDTNLILIDVRQDAEQKVSMLPGALTPAGFAQKYRAGFPTGKRVVTYCTLGNRAGLFAEQLQAKGVPVQNLEGGILAWTHVGGTLLTWDAKAGLQPTRKVHVYAEDMKNWIALNYVAVW